MKFSEEEYHQMEELSMLNYPIDKIACYLDVDVYQFNMEANLKRSKVYFHLTKGKLSAEGEINIKQLQSAKKGNITAMQMVEKKQKENRVSKIKNKVLYGG